MSVSDPQFRPIPLTIVDLIAILFPGALWVFMMLTTYETIVKHIPITPWEEANRLSGVSQSWSFGVCLFVVGSLTGYALKPIALQTAQAVVRLRILGPLVNLLTSSHFRRYRQKMRSQSIRVHDLKFPFDALHSNEDYFVRLKQYFENRLGIKISSSSGYTLFMFAKRHLRLVSPAMWEECERLEAEVRVSASMLLAMLYSALLATLEIVVYRKELSSLILWCIGSSIATCILISGFMHTRDAEVTYTYANCLLLVAEDEAKLARNAPAAGEEKLASH